MKKVFRLILLLLVLSLLLSGCSGNKDSNNKGNNDNEIDIEESEEPASIDYANKDQIYSIEKSGVKLTLQYDLSTNLFLGTIENSSRKKLKEPFIRITYDNGLKAEKQMYSEITCGSSIEVFCLGSYERPDEWYADITWSNSESKLKLFLDNILVNLGIYNESKYKEIVTISEDETNILYAYGGEVPDGGITIDGKTYAGLEQMYTVKKNGVIFIVYYLSSEYNGYNRFYMLMRSITGEEIPVEYIAIEMIGERYSLSASESFLIKPGEFFDNTILLSTISSHIQLWRPVIRFDENDKESFDDKTEIEIERPADIFMAILIKTMELNYQEETEE